MEIFLVTAVGLINIICFITGVSVGQKAAKGERVEMPELNPVEAYREHKSRKVAEKRQSELAAVLENIDNYNGSEDGQKEVR